MLQYVQYNDKNTGPTLVAIPALGERKEIFEALSENLTEFRLIAVDLPGHNGASAKDFSIENYIVDLDKLLKQLSISKAHFIGNSIGAWIIQAYCNRYSESVLSLTLLDGGYYFIGDYADSEEEEIELPIIENNEDLRSAIQGQVESMELLSPNSKERLKTYFLDNFIQQDDVHVHHSDVNALNSLSKAISETNYCLQQRSKLPILILLADQEKEDSVKEKTASFLLLNKNASIKCFPNSYHLLPITNPEAVSQNFNNLVKSLNH